MFLTISQKTQFIKETDNQTFFCMWPWNLQENVLLENMVPKFGQLRKPLVIVCSKDNNTYYICMYSTKKNRLLHPTRAITHKFIYLSKTYISLTYELSACECVWEKHKHKHTFTLPNIYISIRIFCQPASG